MLSNHGHKETLLELEGHLIWPTITQTDQLLLAWRHILKHGGPAGGGDGVRKEDFLSTAESQLGILRKSLLDDTYAPGPVRHYKIPKKNGEVRTISVPCMIDRIAQKAAATAIGEVLDQHFEKSSFAYRKGRSVKLAAQNISSAYRHGFTHVFESDIDDYFNQIDHDLLIEKLWRYIPDADFIHVLKTWLDMADTDEGRLSPSGKGLLQGSPLSPVLSNLYLDELDEVMDGKGQAWIRYADDFVFVCESEKMARNARRTIEGVIEPLGLSLNEEKTEVSTFDGGFRFLGRLFLKSFIMEDRDGLDPEEEKSIVAAEQQRLEVDANRFGASTPADIQADRSNPKAAGFRLVGGIAAHVHELELVVEAPQDLMDEVADGGSDVGSIEPEPLEATQVDKGEFIDDEEVHPNLRRISTRLSPITRTLYVHTAGNRLILKNRSLAVENEQGDLVWAKQPAEVDRIEIGPKCDADTKALRLANGAGITVWFVNWMGEPEGVLEAEPMHRAKLHLMQASMVIDPMRRLEISQAIVAGKIRNQHDVLKRWERNRRDALKSMKSPSRCDATRAQLETLQPLMKPIWSAMGRASRAENISSLMGFEGEAAKLFWRGLDTILLAHEFKARIRRPPPDPVNTVLNWTSHMLARDIRTMVRRSGLHPGFGALHASRDGFSACVYDLIEEFRSPVADSVSCMFLSRRGPHDESFVHRKNQDDSVRCLLSQGGRAELVRSYEKFVTKQLRMNARQGTSWRGLMQQQVYRYMRHIKGLEQYQTVKVAY